jgi:hypothetical protein
MNLTKDSVRDLRNDQLARFYETKKAYSLHPARVERDPILAEVEILRTELHRRDALQLRAEGEAYALRKAQGASETIVIYEERTPSGALVEVARAKSIRRPE